MARENATSCRDLATRDELSSSEASSSAAAVIVEMETNDLEESAATAAARPTPSAISRTIPVSVSTTDAPLAPPRMLNTASTVEEEEEAAVQRSSHARETCTSSRTSTAVSVTRTPLDAAAVKTPSNMLSGVAEVQTAMDLHVDREARVWIAVAAISEMFSTTTK